MSLGITGRHERSGKVRSAGRMTKTMLPCDMCGARGKLWLGGRDYLECPQCEGAKKIPVIEEQFKPVEKKIFIPLAIG